MGRRSTSRGRLGWGRRRAVRHVRARGLHRLESMDGYRVRQNANGKAAPVETYWGFYSTLCEIAERDPFILLSARMQKVPPSHYYRERRGRKGHPFTYTPDEIAFCGPMLRFC
jgi:hypothetical protein